MRTLFLCLTLMLLPTLAGARMARPPLATAAATLEAPDADTPTIAPEVPGAEQPAVIAPASEEAKLAKELFDAVKDGQWWKAVGVALAVLALLQRRYGPKLWPPLGSIPAVVLSAFAYAFLGGLFNALAVDVAVTWDVVWTALSIGFVAAGGWGGVELLWKFLQGRKDDPEFS